MRIALGFILLLIASSSAQAFQKFEDYRILGSEIASIKAVDPEFEEDPEILMIELVQDSITLELETDGGLEDCLQSLEYVVGDPGQYAQIIVQVNAPTMNGSLIVQCTAIGLR